MYFPFQLPRFGMYYINIIGKCVYAFFLSQRSEPLNQVLAFSTLPDCGIHERAIKWYSLNIKTVQNEKNIILYLILSLKWFNLILQIKRNNADIQVVADFYSPVRDELLVLYMALDVCWVLCQNYIYIYIYIHHVRVYNITTEGYFLNLRAPAA